MTDILEPALPWDVLREIAFICPQKTCTTLMRTCTFFHHEAAASILGHEILLYSPDSTARFLNFLHAGKKPRYPCVRHLDLHYTHSPPSPDSAKALADAIALMTGLVNLVIHSGEYTIMHWPAVGDAVASLPSLRQIVIENAGPRSWQIFLSLQSTKFRSVKLHISDSDREPERTPWLSSHPVQLFGRWTSTLTEFQYSSPRLPAPQYTPPFHLEVYPMMRTLSICHGDSMNPSPYIRAFPNLAHLHVHCTSRIYGAVYEDRTSNIRSQREVQLLGPAPQHSGWQELIQFNNNRMDDTPLPPLSTVLADARPLHLNIHWSPWNLPKTQNSLPEILQMQGASRLQSLVVSCEIYEATPVEDVASALCSLATSLAMLPGPFRRLRMGIYYLGDTDQSDKRSPSSVCPSLEHRLTIAVANGDVETIVQNFVETIPTLEDVLVTYSSKAVELRQATFEHRSGDEAIMRIGGTWVTDDSLYCVRTLAPRRGTKNSPHLFSRSPSILRRMFSIYPCCSRSVHLHALRLLSALSARVDACRTHRLLARGAQYDPHRRLTPRDKEMQVTRYSPLSPRPFCKSPRLVHATLATQCLVDLSASLHPGPLNRRKGEESTTPHFPALELATCGREFMTASGTQCVSQVSWKRSTSRYDAQDTYESRVRPGQNAPASMFIVTHIESIRTLCPRLERVNPERPLPASPGVDTHSDASNVSCKDVCVETGSRFFLLSASQPFQLTNSGPTEAKRATKRGSSASRGTAPPDGRTSTSSDGRVTSTVQGPPTLHASPPYPFALSKGGHGRHRPGHESTADAHKANIQ
ncbi:hypothetical protein C8Q74DRAFT_1220244 [Fomes fomentarius]|nr:hypothetical protein C8Q74DRAFT_1220244 [Fomes fomentarius]